MIKQNILLLIFLICLCCAGQACADNSSTLPGHYYLEGVREVGSELLLLPSGRYQWMLAYGNLDYHSEGNWSQQQEKIVLQADPVKETKKLFSFDKISPVLQWDSNAEQFLQDELFRVEEQQVFARCPFLNTDEYASSPSLANDLQPAELKANLRKAQAELVTAKADFEKMAEQAMKQAVRETLGTDITHASENAELSMDKAVVAMARFQSAWAAVKDSHWAAGLPVPAKPVLTLPAECTITAKPTVDPAKSDSFRGGQSVKVGDSEAGLSFSGIEVEFVFSDGHVERRVTGRSGRAAVASRPPAILQKILLSPANGSRAAEALIVPPGDAIGNIYMINLDSKAFAKPFFTSLELEITGNKLYYAVIDGSYVKR